jgi:hypothetical protein
MQVIHNHFGNTTTYLVAGICINGCQAFTANRMAKVFVKFDVPKNTQAPVRAYFLEVAGMEHSEAEKLAAVSQNGDAIKHITDPSEAVQLAAIRQNTCTIMYIPNPSEAVQVAAVRQNGYAIMHITNPSEAAQLAAVSQYGCSIEYTTNPSEAVQLAAVSQNGYAIKHITNPSEAVQLAAEIRRLEACVQPRQSQLAAMVRG